MRITKTKKKRITTESSHIQRGNVIHYQVAGNSDPLAMQDAMQGIEHDIQFDQRRSSHAIDHSQDLITCLEAQVFDDGSSKHLGYLECRGKLSTPPPRFAMDANANLHFVLTQLQTRLPPRWHTTRSQGHTHAAPLLIHLPRQRRY